MFTSELDAYILMAHFRSATRNQDGTWSYSLQSCFDQFVEAVPNENVNYRYIDIVFGHHKRQIINRFERKNCICKDKPTGRPTTLTEAVVNDIEERMNQSPKKSLRRLSAQSGVSKSSCAKALHKNLHMYPYRVSVVQQLYPRDYEQRILYCQWFNEHLNNNDLLDLTFFTDEAWFYLSGYVNSQNYRTWATENPHTFVEKELHPLKVGIWIAISRRRIIGPIFFNDTINAERYQTDILAEFINQLHDDEITRGYFQQDGATAHTAQTTIDYLQQFYGNRIISQGLWPPRSPDLTPPDYFLFGQLKNHVYKNRLHNLNELQEAIRQEIQNITQEQLGHVFENMKRRIALCLEANGEHFQQFL